MDGGVGRRCVGMSQVNMLCCDRMLCKRRPWRSWWFNRRWKHLRV